MDDFYEHLSESSDERGGGNGVRSYCSDSGAIGLTDSLWLLLILSLDVLVVLVADY